MSKKRLEDLYVRGREVTLTDGNTTITVWVKKLNRIDHRQAIQRANAARARVMAMRSEPDSDEYLAIRGDVYEIDDRDELIGRLTADEERNIRVSADARIAAEDEWSQDGYLDGLREAWTEGLAERFAEDPDDPEARRVFNELKRFTEQANEEAASEVEAVRASYAHVPLDDLRDKCVDLAIKFAAEEAWMEEFYAAEMWLSVRDQADHRQRYYKARYEIDELEDTTWVELRSVIEELRVDPLEGKDSEGTPTSSPPSEPSGEAATEVPSGLVAVGA